MKAFQGVLFVFLFIIHFSTDFLFWKIGEVAVHYKKEMKQKDRQSHGAFPQRKAWQKELSSQVF